MFYLQLACLAVGVLFAYAFHFTITSPEWTQRWYVSSIQSYYQTLAIVYISILLICILQIMLGILLLVVTAQVDPGKAKLWLICTGILLFARIVVYVVHVASPHLTFDFGYILIELTVLLFLLYGLGLVYRLCKSSRTRAPSTNEFILDQRSAKNRTKTFQIIILQGNGEGLLFYALYGQAQVGKHNL